MLAGVFVEEESHERLSSGSVVNIGGYVGKNAGDVGKKESSRRKNRHPRRNHHKIKNYKIKNKQNPS